MTAEGGDAAPVSAGGPPAAPPWRMSHAGVLLCAFVFVQLLFGLIPGVPPGGWLRGLDAQLLVSAVTYAAFVPLVFLVVRRAGGRPGREAGQLGLRRPRRRCFWAALAIMGAGAVAFLGVTFALAGVLHCFGVRLDQFPVQPLVRMIDREQSIGTVIAAGLLATVGAPMTEELLFRSVLYLPLRARLGVLPAAVVVSVLFGTFHMYPWGMAQLVVLSLTFVALFERTGSLWYPMVAHGLYNGLMILLVRLLALPGGLTAA